MAVGYWRLSQLSRAAKGHRTLSGGVPFVLRQNAPRIRGVAACLGGQLFGGTQPQPVELPGVQRTDSELLDHRRRQRKRGWISMALAPAVLVVAAFIALVVIGRSLNDTPASASTLSLLNALGLLALLLALASGVLFVAGYTLVMYGHFRTSEHRTTLALTKVSIAAAAAAWSLSAFQLIFVDATMAEWTRIALEASLAVMGAGTVLTPLARRALRPGPHPGDG